MPTRALFDAVAGTPANAADVDKLAKGWCGLDEITSAIGPTSSTTELTIHTISVPVLANRKLKLTYHCPRIGTTVNSDEFLIRVYYDGTAVSRVMLNPPDQTVDQGLTVTGTVSTTTAGNKTCTATIQRQSGTGTATINPGAGFPSFLLVEDIGPSS